MPNHIHLLVYSKNYKNTTNKIIGNLKRFLAYKIVRRLKKSGRNDLLELLNNAVSQSVKKKGKLHEVFMTSATSVQNVYK